MVPMFQCIVPIINWSKRKEMKQRNETLFMLTMILNLALCRANQSKHIISENYQNLIPLSTDNISFLHLLSLSTFNLSPALCIEATIWYWNSIFPTKDRNYNMTRDFELWCREALSLGDLSEQYISIVSLGTVQDFKLFPI